MEYKINGCVRERESGQGVPNLIIRAYDKDLFFDDLLGSCVTDEKGQFEIYYSDKDFRELFEQKPDIYFSIYAPPFRFLINTKDAIRWNVSKSEYFEIEIDRDTLGDVAPSRPDDEVGAGIALSKDDLQLKSRGGFDIPDIPRFSLGGNAGAPALPEQVQYMALPLAGDILDIKVVSGDPVPLTGQVNLLPVQEPVPDVGTDPEQFGDGFSIDNISVDFTPPDSTIYDGKKLYPEKLVELVKSEKVGAMQIVAIKIRPVQYNPIEKNLIFYPDLSYSVKFDKDKARQYAEKNKKPSMGMQYAQLVDSLLARDLVASAKDLYLPGILIPEETPHLIITDNYAWPESVERGDGTTRAPDIAERGDGLTGDLTAEFERLAAWKTAKGMRSRVVTISDIVSGTYGDFTLSGFTRDLQEVIRNFLKYAHKHWDTLYVLLAGDVNVLPMRKLTGCGTYKTFGCSLHSDNPPPEKKCHFVSGKSVVKIRPYFTPKSTEALSTLQGGVRIPFDREAGSGRLGWYYTSEDDLKNKNEGFTRMPAGQTSRYIIVEGPESVIDDHYYWLREANSIPSDLYFSSLESPDYSIPGKHDFDDNNNELYGQYYYDSSLGKALSLDAVDTWPDVIVGRASVGSAMQASAFVDKVITYERLETPDGSTSVDTNYLQQILFASAYWGRLWISEQADTTMPPTEGRFTHQAGTTVTKIHTKFDLSLTAGTPSHRLVTRTATSNVILSYNTSATPTTLGWYFTTDDTYTTQSATPTRFIKVVGPEADIDVDRYLLDPVGLELCVQEKENTRALMSSLYPGFTTIERHYEDYYDLSTPPSLVPLETETIRTSLNNGVHFASLSGHGSWGGCCGVSISSEPDFSNNHKYFIMYSNSCSTAKPDGVDSLAEVSTIDPDGGAVAYVGFTRYGWIGVGDNYEDFFWSKIDVTGRAGTAAGLRLATGGMRHMWTIYTQTFFGDPEMPVWTEAPGLQDVAHPAAVAWGGSITITVRVLSVPVAGHQVTIMGGWTDSSHRPKVLLSKYTNHLGQASFSLPSAGNPVDKLEVTVTKQNFKPYIGTIQVAEQIGAKDAPPG